MRNFKHIWNKLRTTNVSGFVATVPDESVGRFSEIILSLLALLPIFVSMTVNFLPNKAIYTIDGVFLLSAFVNAYWFICLLAIAYFMFILTIFKFIKLLQNRNTIKNNFRFNASTMLPICLFLLLIWSLFSALHSSNSFTSFFGDSYRRDGFLTYCIYAFAFIVAGLLNRKQINTVIEILTAVCAFTGLITLIKGTLTTEWFYLYTDTTAAMFHNNNHFGYFLAICTPLGIGLAIKDNLKSTVLKALRILELWLIFNAVAYNSCRGSFLAIIFTLIVFNIIIFFFYKNYRFKILAIDFLFLFTILFLNSGSILNERLSLLLQQILNLADAQTLIAKREIFNGMGSGRGELWRTAINLSLKEPIFGYGPDNLGYMLEKTCANDRPHNELIQIAASLGIPALILYISGLSGHLASFIKNFKELSLLDITLLASVGGYLISSLFGNTMYNTTPYFYMILGFSYNLLNKKIKSLQKANI